MRMERMKRAAPVDCRKSLGSSPNSVDQFQDRTAAAKASRPFRPFRIGLRVEHLGRYVAQSKRRIVWRFGLWQPGPLPESRVHGQNHREEHELKLIWSVRTGKTVLVWNGLDISHKFRSGETPKETETLQFSWQSKQGIRFRIVAHANAIPGGSQYDLQVEQKSFKALPSLSQLLESNRVISEVADTEAHPDERDSPQPIHPANVTPDQDIVVKGDADNSFEEEQRLLRMSGAGFGSPLADEHDELRSDMYSRPLDQLRDYLGDATPVTQMKDVVSRAIVNILSSEMESDSSHDESLSVDFDSFIDPTETEADLLYDTIEWLKENGQRRDYESASLDFLEREIEVVVSHVRHDRLTPLEASNMVIPVAAMLGLEMTRQLKRDTIALHGLSESTTTQDIVKNMNHFGEVDVAAVSRRCAEFAICRFTSEAATARVCVESMEGRIRIVGVAPAVWELLSLPFPLRREESSGTFSFMSDTTSMVGSDDEGYPPPMQSRASLLGWNTRKSTPESCLFDMEKQNSLGVSDEEGSARRQSAPHIGESESLNRSASLCWTDLEKTHRRQSATRIDVSGISHIAGDKDLSLLSFSTSTASM